MAFCCTAMRVSGQIIPEDTTTTPPFFAAKRFNSKCYVGFDAQAGQILKTKAAMNLGLSLNWVINHKYVVTAKYSGITTPVNVQSIVAPNDNLRVVKLNSQFAGLGFSYILFNSKRFSFQPELCAGWGGIKYKYINTTYRKDFGSIIPAVYGVYNATKYFRLGLGLNYRVAIGSSLNGLSSADISGVSGIVFIRVGTF